MKIGISPLALCLLLILPVAAQEKTDRETDGLKGPVKSVRAVTTSYKDRSGEWVSERTEIATSAYSTQDRILLYSRHSPDGSLHYQYAYSYDSAGKLAERKHYVSGGKLSDVSFYTYNDKGMLVSVVNKAPDGQAFATETYKYDNRGKQIEQTYTSQVSFLIKEESIYDGSGILRESIHTSGFKDSLLHKKATYTYKADGKLEKVTLYRLREKPQVERVRNYDSNERVIEFIVYSGDGSVELREVSEYDGNGNQTLEARYGGDGTLISKTTTRYEYDKFGNWTSKVEETALKDGKPYDKEVTKRDIAYF